MRTYTFNISLSILNHLGRNLYRSFITVLGEAISNSWDADATNVSISIDREQNTLIITDDGIGMDSESFQNKFLKIGYSKRKDNVTHTQKGRPFIGRKGIGKLALLSCAKKITILTKTIDSDITGGVIENAGLDQAIIDDVSANDYILSIPEAEIIDQYKANLANSGTVIIFEDITDGIKNKIEYIRKQVAYFFRFSILDPTFNISINNNPITLDELNDVIQSTQFVWPINETNDALLTRIEESDSLKKNEKLKISGINVTGFIATVERPSLLKIRGSNEKVTLDLFVNGRLRESNILKHIHTARIVESYLYGQIHYNDLDDETDRFTSSREGVVSDDPKYKELLSKLEKIIKVIINDWDVWRVDINQDGDAENTRITRKERKSKELYSAVSDDFIPPKENNASRTKVEGWVRELGSDAEFNFITYSECFVSENLLRKYILDKNITIDTTRANKVSTQRTQHNQAKNRANISFDIRENDHDLTYLSMDDLSALVESDASLAGQNDKASLYRDAKEYKPIRDAMAHTARLTRIAKSRLNITYENIKARIITLLKQA